MAWHQFATHVTNYRSFGGDFERDFKLRKLGYNPHHRRVGWILKAQNLDLHLPGLWMEKTWLHVHFGLSWDITNIWNDKLLLIYVHSKHHSSYLWLLINMIYGCWLIYWWIIYRWFMLYVAEDWWVFEWIFEFSPCGPRFPLIFPWLSPQVAWVSPWLGIEKTNFGQRKKLGYPPFFRTSPVILCGKHWMP